MTEARKLTLLEELRAEEAKLRGIRAPKFEGNGHNPRGGAEAIKRRARAKREALASGRSDG